MTTREVQESAETCRNGRCRRGQESAECTCRSVQNATCRTQRNVERAECNVQECARQECRGKYEMWCRKIKRVIYAVLPKLDKEF